MWSSDYATTSLSQCICPIDPIQDAVQQHRAHRTHRTHRALWTPWRMRSYRHLSSRRRNPKQNLWLSQFLIMLPIARLKPQRYRKLPTRPRWPARFCPANGNFLIKAATKRAGWTKGTGSFVIPCLICLTTARCQILLPVISISIGPRWPIRALAI